jgi:hypothetical protein
MATKAVRAVTRSQRRPTRSPQDAGSDQALAGPPGPPERSDAATAAGAEGDGRLARAAAILAVGAVRAARAALAAQDGAGRTEPRGEEDNSGEQSGDTADDAG